MFQAVLLLVGYALSDYLYFINKVFTSVIIGFTSFGLLFHLHITSATTLSYNCTFQMPVSLTFHVLVCIDDKNKKYLKRSRVFLGHIFSQKKRKGLGTESGDPYVRTCYF